MDASNTAVDVRYCPETLARDLDVLVGKGYKMEYAVPVDLFPWTEHCEAVSCLWQEKIKR